MSHHATHAELLRYREQGFFLREGVLGQADLEPLRQAVERIVQSEGAIRKIKRIG